MVYIFTILSMECLVLHKFNTIKASIMFFCQFKIVSLSHNLNFTSRQAESQETSPTQCARKITFIIFIENLLRARRPPDLISFRPDFVNQAGRWRSLISRKCHYSLVYSAQKKLFLALVLRTRQPDVPRPGFFPSENWRFWHKRSKLGIVTYREVFLRRGGACAGKL